MSEPRRLHPITVLFHAFQTLKEFILPFFIFVVFGSRNLGPLSLFASILFIVCIVAVGFGSWLRYTYRIEEDELRIEYGLFVRKKRFIPFERIQSFDLSQGIIHRLFGLVKVSVETAGASEQSGEVVLTAISKEEANTIQYLLGISKNEQQQVSEEEELLYKMNGRELFLLAASSGGVGVVFSAFIALVSQFNEFIPYDFVVHRVENVASNNLFIISILLLIGFVIIYLLAVIAMMLKFANFTLKKRADDLIITRGWIERKQLSIPLSKIQGIRISENLIRQPFGYSSVYIESAGGSVLNSESASVNILPFIKRDRIAPLLEPHLDGYFLSIEMQSPPQRALVRYLFRGGALVLPVIGIFLFLLKEWGIWSLFFLPVAGIWFYLKYRDAGWAITGNQLTLSYRRFVKHTVYMQRNKIQALSLKSSFFQRKKKLASIEASILSGLGRAGGEVIDLEEHDMMHIYVWYSRMEKAH